MRIYALEENGLGFLSAHKTLESAKKHLSQITEHWKISDEMAEKMFMITETYLYGNDDDD